VLQRAIEEGRVSNVIIDPDPIGVYGDLKEFDKKRKNVVSSSEHQHKEAKKSRSKKFEASLSNSIESINGKTKASKVKANRYKIQADSKNMTRIT
jgi:flagellar hook-basal body complex protein FliE